jgi:hypothetical protein
MEFRQGGQRGANKVSQCLSRPKHGANTAWTSPDQALKMPVKGYRHAYSTDNRRSKTLQDAMHKHQQWNDSKQASPRQAVRFALLAPMSHRPDSLRAILNLAPFMPWMG